MLYFIFIADVSPLSPLNIYIYGHPVRYGWQCCQCASLSTAGEKAAVQLPAKDVSIEMDDSLILPCCPFKVYAVLCLYPIAWHTPLHGGFPKTWGMTGGDSVV